MNKEKITEKELKPIGGVPMLLLFLLGLLLSTASLVFGIIFLERADDSIPGVILLISSFVGYFIFFILLCGLKIVQPNEARILLLFGNYYGTIKKPGFFFVNPFCNSFSPAYDAAMNQAREKQQEGKTSVGTAHVRKTVSLKRQTMSNPKQKVNDVLGNPIIIGAVVIWHVDDPTCAAFSVENYQEFLNIQTDAIIRNTARLYPYDIFDENEDDGIVEKSLRGSSLEIAESMRTELQMKVQDAGLVIEEVRITHLAYAEEIAAAMLQRQQAAAIIAARQKIVDGAVGMVKMAIDRLGEEEVVILDEERKAAMVSNLLVVLCGSKDAQPIVNSGSIY